MPVGTAAHRQGHEAGSGQSSAGGQYLGQYLSPDAAADGGADSTVWAGAVAQSYVGAADPHRLRSASRSCRWRTRKLMEQGVTFSSHLEAATLGLSPERAMEIQYLLGSDITMARMNARISGHGRRSQHLHARFPCAWARPLQTSLIKARRLRHVELCRAAFDTSLREESVPT